MTAGPDMVALAMERECRQIRHMCRRVLFSYAVGALAGGLVGVAAVVLIGGGLR